jgi:LysM repeat protein
MARLGLVAAGRRGFAAPAAFLLAVTIAVVLVHSTRHTASLKPQPHLLIQSKTPVPPARRFYSVAAGDTLAAIAARTGIALTRLRTLNPSLQPTALFIGEKIRLR